MSFTPIEDKARHDRWLQDQIRRHQMPRFDSVSPTYVIRISNPDDALPQQVADAIGEHGASIRFGFGVWNGQVEPDAEITIQAEREILNALLRALADLYPAEQYLHVEKHDVRTAYVDQDDYR